MITFITLIVCWVDKNVIILFFLLSSGFLFAQNTEQNISASFQDMTTGQILSQLESISEVSFFYKQDDFPNLKQTFVWKNIPLQEALNQILEGTDLVALPYKNRTWIIIKQSYVDRNQLASYFNDLQQSIEDSKQTKENWVQVGDYSQKLLDKEQILKGIVVDKFTKEPITGANILFEGGAGTVTEVDGSYEIKLKPGRYQMKVAYIGYTDHLVLLDFQSSGDYSIMLETGAINLDEVTITAVARDAAVKETQSGVARINIKNLDKLPSFLGEKDIVRAVLLNPGVSTIGEGATGFNVRGGNVDQNLIVQDEAMFFNASHALGFFSTFNADLIKEATLSKSTLTADQGGRTASVLEVNLKEGNKEKWRVKAGVNPISATVTADGPLGKNGTLSSGLRASYSDYIFKLFSDVNIKTSSASFYDGTLKYAFKKNGHTLSTTLYRAHDNFVYSNKFGFNYQTQAVSLQWSKLIDVNTSNKFSFVYSKYTSSQEDLSPAFESALKADISYYKIHNKWSYSKSQHKIDAGVQSIFYTTSPGRLAPLYGSSFVLPSQLPNEKGIESAVYLSYQRSMGKHLEMIAGLRLNHFMSLGPKLVYTYTENILKPENITGSESRRGILQQYFVPEPRLSLKYGLGSKASIKLGYARTSQYINQIFNTDTPTPTSQWQLVNNYIKPALSDNLSLGVFANFDDNNYETSIEVYKRNIGRLYDFRDFANLVVNPHIETELLEGRGRTQGLELSIKKNNGSINGWLSYTYSSTQQKVEGINNGSWYSSSFDKPHNLSFIFNYQPKQRYTLTANFTYSSGRPSTAPLSNYLTPDNVYVPVYSNRNQIRIPDYHRLDLSFNLARSHNLAAKVITSWTFTLYNVYGRKNPFSVYYTRGANNTPQANRLAVVGTVFPAIRFNIEFL
ncbi:MAG TPA: carboxypeptidase-like regulatory domain-containing protein [Saprospiraceae bacterium]|nr:carboxypeptidase-like regulatory domain-containing protein [Saprospiraceae bacterium]